MRSKLRIKLVFPGLLFATTWHQTGTLCETTVKNSLFTQRISQQFGVADANKRCKNAAVLCCKMHAVNFLCNYLWWPSLQTHQWSSRDNGAACLKLQSRFLFRGHKRSTLRTHARPPLPPHVWNASSAGQSPSSSARYSFTPSEPCARAGRPSFYFFPTATFLLLALCQSFHCALAMIKDSFVTPSEASGRQKTSNRAGRATHKKKRRRKKKKG